MTLMTTFPIPCAPRLRRFFYNNPFLLPVLLACGGFKDNRDNRDNLLLVWLSAFSIIFSLFSSLFSSLFISLFSSMFLACQELVQQHVLASQELVQQLILSAAKS